MGSCVASFVKWATETFKGQTVTFCGGKDKRQLWPGVVHSFVRAKNLTDFCLSSDQPFPSEHKEAFLEYEKTLFASFKRQARLLADITPKDDWEWLALAQHHELPTRLLDLTKNPLAALYFAVYSETNTKSDPATPARAHDDGGDGNGQIGAHVWAIYWGPLSKGHESMIDPDSCPTATPLYYCGNLTRFIPPIIDTRMALQKGLFTIGDPLVRVDKQVQDARWCDFRINRCQREETRRELHRLGINQATLFPDLYNLAKNQEWVWEHFRHRTDNK